MGKVATWLQKSRVAIRASETALVLGLWATGLTANDPMTAQILLGIGLVVAVLAVFADPGGTRVKSGFLIVLIVLLFGGCELLLLWHKPSPVAVTTTPSLDIKIAVRDALADEKNDEASSVRGLEPKPATAVSASPHQRVSNSHAADDVSVVVTGLPNWGRYAGLDKSFQHDDSLFQLGPVYVTNRSLQKPVTLLFKLRITIAGNPKWVVELPSGMEDSLGRRLGGDTSSQRFLSPPVSLPPSASAYGTLPFLVDTNWPQEWLNEYLMAFSKGTDRYDLEITDVVSGKSFRMPLPGRHS